MPTLEATVEEFLGSLHAENPALHAAWQGRPEERPDYTAQYGMTSMSVTRGPTSYTFNVKEEFLAELRRGYDSASFHVGIGVVPLDSYSHLNWSEIGGSTSVRMDHPVRAGIERVFGILDDAAERFRLPEPEPERPRIFIGHGGANDWQTTERWLIRLGYEVKAYETLPHAGRTIERVLEKALNWANFALLVMTAEDQMANDTSQARQNVVHELGLFQGRLGWDRAVAMLEQGVEEFSNIAGTNQLRFPTGQIESRHGDIAVALAEHFPAVTV